MGECDANGMVTTYAERQEQVRLDGGKNEKKMTKKAKRKRKKKNREEKDEVEEDDEDAIEIAKLKVDLVRSTSIVECQDLNKRLGVLCEMRISINTRDDDGMHFEEFDAKEDIRVSREANQRAIRDDLR